MTNKATDDIVQPISRAVTVKIEASRHVARPDEQTLRIDEKKAERAPMPRAELIRLMTASYHSRRNRD